MDVSANPKTLNPKPKSTQVVHVCMHVRPMSRHHQQTWQSSRMSWTSWKCLVAIVCAVARPCQQVQMMMVMVDHLQHHCHLHHQPAFLSSSIRCARWLHLCRHLGMLSEVVFVVWLLCLVLEVVSSILFECVCILARLRPRRDNLHQHVQSIARSEWIQIVS